MMPDTYVRVNIPRIIRDNRSNNLYHMIYKTKAMLYMFLSIENDRKCPFYHVWCVCEKHPCRPQSVSTVINNNILVTLKQDYSTAADLYHFVFVALFVSFQFVTKYEIPLDAKQWFSDFEEFRMLINNSRRKFEGWKGKGFKCY